MEQRKRGLSKKIILGFVGLGFLIAVCTCVGGYFRYTEVIEKMYNDKAYQIAYSIINYIDGDRLGEAFQQIYAAKSDDELSELSDKIMADEKYQELLQLLDYLREDMGANYIYIADQTEGGDSVTATMTYFMDADNPDDKFESFVPGDTSKMNEEFLEDSKYIYETGNRSDNYFYSHSDFGYNTSAIVAVKNSEGKVVGIVGVEISMKNLQETRRAYLIFVILISILATVVVIGCFTLYSRKFLIKPLQLIADEAEAFVESETKVSEKLSEIKTGDEIEGLAESILTMEENIKDYIDDIVKITSEKERIGAELNVATKIQSDLLPGIFPAFPERKEFEIFASMKPAKEVGGDFYDFFLIDDNHLALVIADVSGKGVPAALFMVITKTLIKNRALMGGTPKEILEFVNNQLCENNEAEMFVTVWFGILEVSTGKVTAANAGHEYPAISHADGKFELLKDKHGFVLAGMENARYREYEFTMEKGSSLYVYTDGVAEAMNSANVQFGTDRMLKALNRKPGIEPEELLSEVEHEVHEFVRETPQFDDITMLCMKYYGKQEDD